MDTPSISLVLIVLGIFLLLVGIPLVFKFMKIIGTIISLFGLALVLCPVLVFLYIVLSHR